jgi:hypothetical protein
MPTRAATGLFVLAALALAPRLESGRRTSLVRGGAGREGISIRVADSTSGEPLPARVVVRDAAGKAVESEYEHLPGVFTADDGALELPLSPGRYTLEVHHGIDFVSQEHPFEVRPGSRATARIALEPWVRLRELGWANGDAHAHLYTDRLRDQAMAATVRRICRAQGVDFLFACQTWAGYGDADWREGYAKVSDDRFRLFYGAEMPKHRTGHTFWYGLTSTRGTFPGAMDESYENLYYLTAARPQWTFDTLPFPNVPDIEVVSRLRVLEDAVAVAPHPTSWWWQPRGEVEKYVTNVAASLPVGLLAGRVWDGLVVMGYDHDQLYYQDLWFHALDEGYRLTPIGELDGGFPPADRFYYGSTRTYLHVGRETTRESIVGAVRAGHAFVTSGPIVLASIDAGGPGAKGRSPLYEPGDVVPADGRSRTLHVRAFSSGARGDRLSYVVLFRNGRIHKLWDLRSRPTRRLETRWPLRETEPAWYVLKAYGRTERAPDQLDVRAVVARITAGRFEGRWPADSAVALTSPFYFRLPGTPPDPTPLVSRVRLLLVDAATGEPVKDATVHVRVEGRTVESRAAVDGRAELRVPVHSVLVLEAPRRPTLHRTLYLDYPPQRARVEHLANGGWLASFGGRERLRPGQVPWEAFDFAGTKADLSEVDWTLPWAANERDAGWDALDAQLR